MTTIQIDSQKITQQINKLGITLGELRKGVKKELEDFAFRLAQAATSDAKSMLPSDWMLRDDLVPRKRKTSRGNRIIAGISFKNAGVRIDRPLSPVDRKRGKSLEQLKRKPKNEKILALNTPRIYFVHHEGFYGSEARWGTPPRHFLTVPLKMRETEFEDGVRRIMNGLIENCEAKS